MQVLRRDYSRMTAEWRSHATPEEIAEHDGLIAQDRANAERRKIIRNRCRMRGKQRKNAT
jgi:hypothetical protein